MAQTLLLLICGELNYILLDNLVRSFDNHPLLIHSRLAQHCGNQIFYRIFSYLGLVFIHMPLFVKALLSYNEKLNLKQSNHEICCSQFIFETILVLCSFIYFCNPAHSQIGITLFHMD